MFVFGVYVPKRPLEFEHSDGHGEEMPVYVMRLEGPINESTLS